MESFAPEKIRNVVLLGHNAVGKTTLAEALLFRAGLITRLGRVEDGNTVTDFEPEEHKRTMSISMALAPFVWKGFKINLIDAPGYADFIGEVRAALWVADLAVFVVSAVDGVEPQTEVHWRMAEELNLPRMLFINKLDSDRASFDRTLEELKDRFGAGIAPIELPIGSGSSFHGVADLFTDKAYVYDSGSASEAPIPDEMEAQEHEVHDALVEGIVVADDDLLAAYLDGDVPSPEVLERTMAKGIAAAKVFPVTCGSATVPIGVDRLADFICEIGPSPGDREAAEIKAGDQAVAIEADPQSDPLAFVFKTIADPYVGRISLFKVLSGTLTPDDHLYNHRAGSDGRLSGIMTMRGKEQESLTSIPAGDIGAVAKLTTTMTGDTLAPKDKPVSVTKRPIPEPSLAVAIYVENQSDESKLGDALSRILDEDPALVLERNEETKQTLLKGMGEVHLAVTLEKMARKFNLEVKTEDVKVPYRETLTRAVNVEGKHKKQSGGHGQFGVAMLEFEPLPGGTGYEFVDKIKGGSIPRQFIPAVDKGLQEAMSYGGKFGYPVVDMRVSVVDGKYHSVDSSEMSFQMAARAGFREAIAQVGTSLLEPISRIYVTVPSAYQGDIMGDINQRRGRIEGTQAALGDAQTITALVPTSEIMRYANDLRSLTGGRGTFVAEHAHYEPAPPQVVKQLTAAAEQ